MSEALGNVRAVPPVEEPGKFLKSNATFGLEWGDAGQALPAWLNATGPLIADFNIPKANGWYRPNNAVNGPNGSGDYGLLMHMEWDGNNGHAHQLYYPMYTQVLWMRESITYVWQPWKKISPIDDSNLPARLASQGPVVTDCNSVTDSGWYACQGATNAPTNGWGHLIVGGWSGPYQTQHFSQLGQNNLFMRSCYNGSWSAWAQIYPLVLDDTTLPLRLASGGFLVTNITDYNQAQASGWYNASPGTANAPINGAHFHLEVIAGSTDYYRQYAHYLYDPRIFTRFKAGANSWSGWNQIYPIDDFGLPARLVPFANLVTDCNSFMTNGWGYTQSGNAANTPFGASAASGPWGVLEAVFMNGTDNGIQRWWQYGSENRFIRSRSNGVWGAWLQDWPIKDGLPGRLKEVADPVPGSDFNQALNNGFYSVSPGFANAPVNAYGALIVVNITYTGSLRQIFYEHANYREWQRYQNGAGNWSAWIQSGFGADNAWLTPAYQNGWASYGGTTFGPARYRRLTNGMVTMAGLVLNAGGPGGSYDGQTIFLLPVGYRPISSVMFGCICYQDATARVSVQPDGRVVLDNQQGYGDTYSPGGWITLGPIHFYADQ